MVKRIIPLLVIVVLVCGAFMCGCKPNEEETYTPVQGGAIDFLDGVQVDYDNMFFDDFTGGVDYDSWYIGKQAWGASPNGGVVPQNVNYTDEGVLVISGNGGYYTSGDVNGVGAVRNGTLCGGAIISKFVTGPGRYEAKMKVLPRLGACSAMWTYCEEKESGDNGNHEIDIELPGGKGHAGVISFQNVLNTNYITVAMNESQDVNVTEVMNSATPVALNDGQWHTFGFDWYTNPEKVVYYVDGIVTAVSNIFVPYYQARLWLGVWFPNNAGFVGNAEFESDVMCVDYVQYIPFLNQPCNEYSPAVASSGVATQDEYPVSPISTDSVNKISNGAFEYAQTDPTKNVGWEIAKRNLTSAERKALEAQIKEDNPTLTTAEISALLEQRINEIIDVDADKMCAIGANLGYVDSCGMCVSDIGRYRQKIDSVYQGFRLKLNFRAKGQGTVTLQFQTEGGKRISDVTLNVGCTDWTDFSTNCVAPQDTQQVSVVVSAVYGGTMYADEFVLYINK